MPLNSLNLLSFWSCQSQKKQRDNDQNHKFLAGEFHSLFTNPDSKC
jgi:hypothetical protein